MRALPSPSYQFQSQSDRGQQLQYFEYGNGFKTSPTSSLRSTSSPQSLASSDSTSNSSGTPSSPPSPPCHSRCFNYKHITNNEPCRPRALSASYIYSRNWGASILPASALDNRRHGGKQHHRDWHEMALPGSVGHENGGGGVEVLGRGPVGGDGADYYQPDTSADYRLGRYFDSMNVTSNGHPPTSTASNSNAPSNNNYRSTIFQSIGKPTSRPSHEQNGYSNGSNDSAYDSRLKPVPRLPEATDMGLPVIRPKRSDSVRSTDSRTTTASSASTLVPLNNSNVGNVSSMRSVSLGQQTQQQEPHQSSLMNSLEDCRSSVRSNTSVSTPTPSTQPSSTKKNSGGSGGPVRRVRFADDPPAEYCLDGDDARGSTPPGGAIVVVTKRLGPSTPLQSTSQSSQSNNMQQQHHNNSHLNSAPAPAFSSSLLSINRVPPPYPHHRQQSASTAVNTAAQSTASANDHVDSAPSNGGTWRQRPLLAAPFANGPPDFADDGYDSVNQTPSEGSVNSTTSSSGLPPSASPDHQQLDSSVDSLPNHNQPLLHPLSALTSPYNPSNMASRAPPSYSANAGYNGSSHGATGNGMYSSSPSQTSSQQGYSTGSLLYNKQQRSSMSSSRPGPPPTSSYSSSSAHATDMMYQPMYQSSSLSSAYPTTAQTTTLPSSYANRQAPYSTLTLPSQQQTSSPSSSSSQYRWMPGRAPTSSLGSGYPSSSTLSLQMGPAPPSGSSPYASSVPSRGSFYHPQQQQQQQPQPPQLSRAPSFRQLTGPEPVYVVAEQDFGSLLDSLPLGVIGRPNYL